MLRRDDRARDTFHSDDFKNKVWKIYDGIFDQMNKDFHYQVLHLSYPQFFNADDDSTWCNDQTLGKIGPSGFFPPKLTLELRRKMNQLSFDFNSALWAIALGYINQKLSQPDRDTAIRNGWITERLFFGSLDGGKHSVYDGHRFCEKGASDKQFGESTTWIFGVWGPQKDVGPDYGNTASSAVTEVGAEAFAQIDASSCGQDPRYNDDDAFAWDCDMAGYYANPSNDHSITTIPGLDWTRSFHPKSRGFTAVKDFLHQAIPLIRTAPAVGSCIANTNPLLYNGGDNPASASPLGVSAPTFTPSGLPASICATAAGDQGFATALGPTPTTSTAPSASPTCTFTGDPLMSGCQCSDGTQPPRDEDNRCCVYHLPPPQQDMCFNQDRSSN